MTEFAVTCVASGPATDPVRLGTQLASLLTALKEFGPIGRFANDGTRFQATLIVASDSEHDARRIAGHAVTMAAAAVRLPNWPVDVKPAIRLAATA